MNGSFWAVFLGIFNENLVKIQRYFATLINFALLLHRLSPTYFRKIKSIVNYFIYLEAN